MLALLLVVAPGCAPSPDAPPAGPRACNGSAAACERRLDQVAMVAAHNAMNVAEEGWLLPNQNVGYEDQVALGVRAFLLDVYDVDGVPTLCHADCALGSEPLATALDRFAALLDAHPDDVMVFVIQDALDFPLVVGALEDAGLAGQAIVPAEPWPTLGALVDADTRLLVTHEQPRPGAPDWYPAVYDLAWDNDYSAASVEDFDCAVLRGDAAHPLFLLNHFLTQITASEALAALANPYAVLRDHVDRCEQETGDRVNWLAVDFVDVGDAVRVVDELNARDPAP